MKKIVIFGAGGFIGNYLFKYLSRMGFNVIGTCFKSRKDGLQNLDLSNYRDTLDFLKKENPSDVIFLAGNKNVAYCERHPLDAVNANFTTTVNYIDACATLELFPKTIYFSTDYVFDGGSGFYQVEDNVHPKTIYGITNYLSEVALKNSELNVDILRVSAVMGKNAGFYKWLLENLMEKNKITLFSNSYFSPTSIQNLSEYIFSKVNNFSDQIDSKINITHFNDGYRFSRYEYAKKIAEKLNISEHFISQEELSDSDSTFQNDLSLLGNGCEGFRDNSSWDELSKIL